MRALFLVLVSLFFIRSNACDCNDIIGMEEAKIVFTGKVLSVKRIEPYIRYEIKFKISKVLKGKWKKKIIVVNTPCLLDACCGIPFEINDIYKIFSFVDNNMLYTNICTATRKLKGVPTSQKPK